MEILRQNKEIDIQRGVDFTGITCVFFCHDGNGRVLLSKRSQKCRDERGRWDCGAGALEFGEDFESAVRREVREEYCTDILDLVFVDVRSVVRDNNGVKTHWVAMIFAAEVDVEKVAIGDPEKMEAIGWFREEAFPEPLHSMFQTHYELVKKSGAFPSTSGNVNKEV